MADDLADFARRRGFEKVDEETDEMFMARVAEAARVAAFDEAREKERVSLAPRLAALPVGDLLEELLDALESPAWFDERAGSDFAEAMRAELIRRRDVGELPKPTTPDVFHG